MLDKLKRLYGKVSLQTLIIVPFILQIIILAVIIIYLSYSNSENSVYNLARQLEKEVNQRIVHHLDNRLAYPNQINQVNLQLIQGKFLDVKDLEMLGKYFWQQMRVFNVDYINYGSPDGDFIGVEKVGDNHFLINERSKTTGGKLYVYDTNDKGDRTKLLEIVENYDHRREAWFTDALKAEKPLWTSIYQWDDKPEVRSISSSYPVYDHHKKLIGVIGVDYIISRLNDFLGSIKVTTNAKTFILEPDGDLVSTSTFEYYDKPTLNATSTKDPLILYVIELLKKIYNNPIEVYSSRQMVFKINQENHFLQINPWRDSSGLYWIIVSIIPERDILGTIHQNTQNSILLSVGGIVVVVIISTYIARSITSPILQLTHVSRGIAQGNLQQKIPSNGTRELIQLSETFQQMQQQVHLNQQELEAKVNDRTKVLQEEIQVRHKTQQELEIAKEAAEAADRSKSLFISNISHELRTPLNAILGFSQILLSDNTLPSKYQQDIGTIFKSGKDLLSLINKLLELSRIDKAEVSIDQIQNILYDHNNNPSQASTSDLTTDAISELPQEWLNKLNDAILNADMDLITHLLEEIRPEHPSLATQIFQLLEDFEYDKVINMINQHDPRRT